MSDVNVDALFRWFKPVPIKGRQIWMRTLGASDDTARARKSLGAARRHRAALNREGSPEREELLSELNGLERQDLLDIIRVTKLGQAQSLSLREVHPLNPPEPVSPTLDDVIEAEDKRAEQDEDLIVRRTEWVQERIERVMSELDAIDYDGLLQEAIDTEISSEAAQAHMLEFSRQTLFRACYEDKKFTKKTFSSAAEVGELDREVFTTLLGEYSELDRFSLNSDDLKN